MLTYLSRAVGLIVCLVFMLVGMWVALKKFIRNYIIVSEYNEAKRKRAESNQTKCEA